MPYVNTPDRLEYQFFPAPQGVFTFKVRCPNDAHLALTTQPGESLPMYEIFIGGWSNSKSVIRKNRQKPDVVEIPTPGIVNGSENRGFWIRWYDNTIAVGREGEGSAFMSYNDPQLFPIRFVGICTGWGASGSWSFDDSASVASAPSMAYNAPPMGGAPNMSYDNPSMGYNAPPMNYAAGDPNMGYPGAGGHMQGGGGGGGGTWIPASNGVVPPNAVSGGYDGSDNLYIARARHGADLIPGKLHPSHGSCYVAYGGNEHSHKEYEVLCSGFGRWVPWNGNVPPNAVPGGHASNGETLFIGRAAHDGSTTVGKVQPSYGTCFIPYGGQEMAFKEFEIYVQ